MSETRTREFKALEKLVSKPGGRWKTVYGIQSRMRGKRVWLNRGWV